MDQAPLPQAAARRLASGGRSTCSAPTYLQPVARRGHERRRQRSAQPAVALEPEAQRLQNRERHRPQLSQRLVRVLAHVEVDLGDRVEPRQLVGVDQQRDVDAVAGHERKPLEQLTPGGDLARQRLLDSGQVRVEEVQQRPRRQLGHAAAAVRQRHVADPERPPVEALDEREARARTAADPAVRRRSAAPNCSESASRKQTTSPRQDGNARHIASPLPSTGPSSGSQAPLVVHLGAERARDLCGTVGRVVDDHDLVDHAEFAELEHGFENRADRTRLVAGRKADRDGLVALSREPRRRKL